jgi:hypothetical protein
MSRDGGEGRRSRPLHGVLPASNPYIGTICHAPSAKNRSSTFFSEHIIYASELAERKKYRQNPYTGTFHFLPGYYSNLYGLNRFRRADVAEEASLPESLEQATESLERPASPHRKRALRRRHSIGSVNSDDSPISETRTLNGENLDLNLELGNVVFDKDDDDVVVRSVRSSPSRSTKRRQGSFEKVGGVYSDQERLDAAKKRRDQGLRPWEQEGTSEYSQTAPDPHRANPFIEMRMHDRGSRTMNVPSPNRSASGAAFPFYNPHAPRSMGNADSLDDNRRHARTSHQREQRLEDMSAVNDLKPLFIKEERIAKHYEMDLKIELGKGAYAVVVPATHRRTGAKVAIKTMLKKYLTQAKEQAKVRREVELHRRLKHEHIVRVAQHMAHHALHTYTFLRTTQHTLIPYSCISQYTHAVLIHFTIHP